MSWMDAICALLDGHAIRRPGWATHIRLTDRGLCLCRGRDARGGRPLTRHTLESMSAAGRFDWEIAEDLGRVG